MLEYLKKRWIEWFISASIAIIAVLITQSFIIKRESSSALMQKIDTKASIEYVDQQDANLEKMLEQHSKQSTELMQSMDSKIDILLSRVK